MMRRTMTALVALALLLPSTAWAQEAGEGGRMILRTRTLVLAQDDTPGVFAEFPVYQWLELAGYDLGTPGLSVHTSLWGFAGLAEDDFDLATGDQFAGDISLLYAQYNDPRGRFGGKVGRFVVNGGPGLAYFGQIDGGSVRGAMGPVDLQVYGGHWVQRRFANLDQNDWLAGARLGYRRWGLANLGVSYVRAWNDGEVARDLIGADLAVGRIAGFDMSGFASFDLVSAGLAEAGAHLRYQVFDGLTFGLLGRQASPGRLIDRSSIFSVFALGDWAEGGALVEWAVLPQLVLGGEYARVFFPGESAGIGEGEESNRYGARITAYPDPDLWLRLGFDRLPSLDNGYTSVRLAGRWSAMKNFALAADLFAYFYDDPPLDIEADAEESLTGQLFAEYALAPGVNLGLGGFMGRTVYSDFEARGLLRLTWTSEWALGGAR